MPRPRDGSVPVIHQRPPGPLPPYPVVLEEELELQNHDIQWIVTENRHVVKENTDIDGMRKDLVNMRLDYKTLKKTNEEHMIQKEAMAKNLILMAREIEKLRGEHMRTCGLGGGGYGVMSGSPVMRTSHVALVHRANLRAGQVFGIAGAEHPKKASRSGS
nr:hypothetical protein [Tanacetum cinerariifolium]GEZ09258.1 hypothetical protein [Tanacetum cinerariifolium]